MGYRVFVLSCLLAALAPFCPKQETKIDLTTFPGWPKKFRNCSLSPISLSEKEIAFFRRFPGKTAKFVSGNTKLVLRFVTTRTRRLHPAAHCYRGIGYETTPRPLWVDEKGQRWGCTRATHQDGTLYIYERLWDNRGHSWSDVSSWYWASLLGRSSAPWWTATIVSSSPLSTDD